MFGPIQTNSLSWRQSPAAGRLCQPHAVGRHTVAAVGILLFFVLAAQGQETNKPEGEQWFKRLDARQFSDLEETIQKVYATVAPSVVCISREDGRMGCSGVIVSSSGEVVTCAHHNFPPQTKVTVELGNGRRVKGTMLGLVKKPENTKYDRAHDVGMMRLDAKREWPAVSLGRPSDLDNGQMCLAIGYPGFRPAGQPPLVRLGRVLPPQQ